MNNYTFSDPSKERVFGSASLNYDNQGTPSQLDKYAERFLWGLESNPLLASRSADYFASTDGAAFTEWAADNPQIYANEDDIPAANLTIVEHLNRMSLNGLSQFANWHGLRYLHLQERFKSDKDTIDASLLSRGCALYNLDMLPVTAVGEVDAISSGLPPVKPMDAFYAAKLGREIDLATESLWDKGPIVDQVYSSNMFSDPQQFTGVGDSLLNPLMFIHEIIRQTKFNHGFTIPVERKPTHKWLTSAMVAHYVTVSSSDNAHFPIPTVIYPNERIKIISKQRNTSISQGRDNNANYLAFRERSLLGLCSKVGELSLDLLVAAHNGKPDSKERAEVERRLARVFRSAYPTFTEEPLYVFSERYNKGPNHDGNRSLIIKTFGDIFNRFSR